MNISYPFLLLALLAEIIGTIGGFGSSVVTLSGTLDFLRIIASATGAPSDTFDAGSINILYE